MNTPTKWNQCPACGGPTIELAVSRVCALECDVGPRFVVSPSGVPPGWTMYNYEVDGVITRWYGWKGGVVVAATDRVWVV